MIAQSSRARPGGSTIFLREPETVLFGTFESDGTDFAADTARIAADPTTRDWWAPADPCQEPLASRKPGEQGSFMEEVFPCD
jgi:L-rhamnose mutarotase